MRSRHRSAGPAPVRKLPRVRKIVLETRLEFVSSDRLRQIAENGAVGQVSVNSWLSR